MGVADYLAGLNLDPGTAARLQGMIGPPNVPGPAPAPVDPDGAPSPEEMARYGAKPAEIAVAQNANQAAASGAASVASPTAQPAWSPEAQEQRTQAAQEAATADAPQDLGDQGHGQREAPATPGRYVPAHWQPTNRQEAIAYGMDPEALAPAKSASDAAAGHSLAAGDKRLEAAQQQGVADAVYAASHAAASQHAAEQMRRIENEKQQYMVREQEKLADLTTHAAAKVDPDAAQGSIGAQILATIGIALGAFGASINGGQNQALQIVNAGIDRRIRAQEANIANAKQSLKDEQSLYRQNLDAFGDRERAVLATKIQYLEQVKAMGDQQYAAAKHTMNEADKHEWDAKVLQQQAQYQTQFAQMTENKRTTQGSEHFVPGQTVGGSGGPKKELSNLVTLSDGTTVQMPNEKQQDKAIEKIQILSKLQRMNNEALRARSEITKLDPILDRTKYNEVHKTLEDLEETKAALISSEAGQGVLRDSEYARSIGRQGFYTDGIGFFKGNPVASSARAAADANLRKQIARGDADQRAFVKAAGGHIVERGYATDATGQKSPVARYTGQDVAPTEQLPTKNFKPLKSSAKDQPVADDPLGEVTPFAKDFGFIPAPTPSAPREKKKGHK